MFEAETGTELPGGPVLLRPELAEEIARPLSAHPRVLQDMAFAADTRRRLFAGALRDLKRLEGDLLCDPDNPEPLRSAGLMDLVVLPPIDWHYRVQRPQRLSIAWAELGCRVTYLSTDFLPDEPGVPPFALLGRPHPGVMHVKLRRPLPHRALNVAPLSAGEADGLTEAFASFAAAIGLARPIFVVGSPGWARFADVAPGLVVYDCMDRFDAFEFATPEISAAERRLLVDAGVVLTASEPLAALAREHGRSPVVVRNAASASLFGITPAPAGPQIVAGYVGAVEQWFDGELLATAATLAPEISFEIYGHVGSEEAVASLAGTPNVQLHGEMPSERLATVLARFDVALIPFERNMLIEYTNPVKVYEYLAAGLPVVSTPMPELERFKPLVAVAATAQEFTDAIREAAATRRDPERISERRAAVAGDTWRERGLLALSAIEAARLQLGIFLVWHDSLPVEVLRAWLERPLRPRNLYVVLDATVATTPATRRMLALAAESLAPFAVVGDTDDAAFSSSNLALVIDPLSLSSVEFLIGLDNPSAPRAGAGWALIEGRRYAQAWRDLGRPPRAEEIRSLVDLGARQNLDAAH